MARKNNAARAATSGTMVDSAAKRGRLAARKNPYWLPVGPQRGGVSLGYRKPINGPGSWIIRLIVDGKRHEDRLGAADDIGAAPGALDYAQAVTRALEEGSRRKDSMRRSSAPEPAVTVRQAITAYVLMRKRKDDRNGRDAESRLNKHLLADRHGMADRTLAELNDRHWSKWRAGLTGLQPTSVTRVVADVKAAMNAAWEVHRHSLPATWKDNLAVGLRPSRGTPSPVHLPPREYLPDEDVRRLIGAAFEVDDDFGRLVLLLAATGARFSQVARMVIGDVIGGESPHVMVPPSRKGRPGSHAPTAIKVQVGLDVVDALRPAMAGRPGHEPLLLRWHHVQEKGDPAIGTKPHWRQAARVKWRVAADMTRRWDEAVLIAGLPSTMTPYRLRDAAIIRMLREGMPLELVANLANTSEKMIRRSYARHIHDALDDLARKAVVPLAPIQVTKLKVVGE